MPPRFRCSFLLSVSLVAHTTAQQQPPGAPTQPPPKPSAPARPQQPPSALTGVTNGLEIAAVSHGWTLLSQGLFAQAAARGAELLNAFPRSATVLTFAIESRIDADGANAGLDQYERWLGSRRNEEPVVLRRIAVAVLRERSRQSSDPTAQSEALRGLADESARTPSTNQELPTDPVQIRAAAAAGNEAAVSAVIKDFTAGSIDALTAARILGDSGSRLAVAPLLEKLNDPRPEVRGSAADALGRLGAAGLKAAVAARLKALLSDESSFVRIRAAGALVRLDDQSGMPLLTELASNESAPSRLIAAEALASHPDPRWIELVRDLTQAQEPEVRVRAAVLIAPHDAELSSRILEQLQSNENPAIREMARQALPEAADNLTSLRRLLRSDEPLTIVKAAARIVSMTR
jgi:HEAT repeat protein